MNVNKKIDILFDYVYIKNICNIPMQLQQSCDIKHLSQLPDITNYTIVSDDKTYQKTWEISSDFCSSTITGSINPENNEYIGKCVVRYKGGLSGTGERNKVVKYVGPIRREGEGIEYYTNGDIFYGTFKDNVKHGPGKLYFKDMSLKYDGIWENDILQGTITGYLFDDNGTQYYFGQIHNNCPNGIGCLIKNGKYIQVGIWSDEKITHFLKFTESGKLKYHLFEHEHNIINQKYIAFTRDKSIESLMNLKEYLIPSTIDKLKIQEYDKDSYNTRYIGEIVMIDGEYKYNGQGIYCFKDYIFKGMICNNKIIEGNFTKVNSEVLASGTYLNLSVSDLDITETIDVRKYLIKGTVPCIFKCGLENRRQNCRYTGTFANGTFEHGILEIVNSYKLYEGGFDVNVQVFTANYTTIDKLNYSGQGTEYYDNVHVKYDGYWKQGKYNGDGSFFNGETFTMEYSGNHVNGIRNGAGTLFDPEGNVIWAGNFREGDIA